MSSFNFDMTEKSDHDKEGLRLLNAVYDQLWRGRTPGDPDGFNGWSPPLTETRLTAGREAAIQRTEHDHPEYGAKVRAEGFTCDGCSLAPTCGFVFDPYNTNGDCLLEK